MNEIAIAVMVLFGGLTCFFKNSIEAAKTYCKAFGAEITFEIKNDSRTAYEHCELSVNGGRLPP